MEEKSVVFSQAGAAPGRLILQSGANATPVAGLPPFPCGDIIFRLGDGTECLRFETGGRVFVRDELVEDNQLVWARLREWMQDAKVLRPEDAAATP